MVKYDNKDIIVTGGAGSIGSEIVRQLLKTKAKRIRVFDHNEQSLWKLQQELKDERLRFLIGDVRDRERLKRAFEGTDTAFHAAALKHVPLCEYNPFEAVSTNVQGTQYAIEAAIHNNLELFVNISTDKAVNPTSVLGATKLLGEKLVREAPAGYSKCKFLSVRFGNVLHTSGSIIPLFKKQLAKGVDLTLTSATASRFFMSIEEAVELVLNAGLEGSNGEIYILKMKSVLIKDIAETIIREVGPGIGRDPAEVEIEIIGLRQGEKLHEELYTHEELPFIKTKEKYYVVCKERIDEKFSMYNSITAEKASKEEVKKMVLRKK